MPQDVPHAIGFHQAEPMWRDTESKALAHHAPVAGDITNRTLISPCFCGGRSPGIYSESHLPAANNVHLGVSDA
jgi:hypothetical protein